MSWRAFALVRDDARRGRRYTGIASAAAGLLPCFESLLLAFLHDEGSLDDFSHAGYPEVNHSLIMEVIAVKMAVGGIESTQGVN